MSFFNRKIINYKIDHISNIITIKLTNNDYIKITLQHVYENDITYNISKLDNLIGGKLMDIDEKYLDPVHNGNKTIYTATITIFYKKNKVLKSVIITDEIELRATTINNGGNYITMEFKNKFSF